MAITRHIPIILMSSLIVGVAVSEEAYAIQDYDQTTTLLIRQPEHIQIVAYDTKRINWIIPSREITTIQYKVQMEGYTIECVSIVFNTPDGRMISHAYNKCTEHLDGDRRR